MTLQWAFVAGFLYFEIFVVCLLLLPISPTIWQQFFRCRMILFLSAYANLYFNVIVAIFLLLFADSVREVRRYSQIEFADVSHPHSAQGIHMKQFRAQRNFYIAGFALFLWFVISRLINLISKTASFIADAEASKRQALSATRAAEQLLSTQSTEESRSVSDEEKEKRISFLTQELRDVKAKYETLKEQSESVLHEYDLLQAEHSKLQREINVMKGDAENAKNK